MEEQTDQNDKHKGKTASTCIPMPRGSDEDARTVGFPASGAGDLIADRSPRLARTSRMPACRALAILASARALLNVVAPGGILFTYSEPLLSLGSVNLFPAPLGRTVQRFKSLLLRRCMSHGCVLLHIPGYRTTSSWSDRNPPAIESPLELIASQSHS